MFADSASALYGVPAEAIVGATGALFGGAAGGPIGAVLGTILGYLINAIARALSDDPKYQEAGEG